MSTALTLTANDPIVARDGRPFGVGQGNRMRGLPWPLPSVVAGSFRTALGKAEELQFTPEDSKRLFNVQVAGVFPVHHGRHLYLPVPADCVVHPDNGALRVHPEPEGDGGCDFPDGLSLRPVMLSKKEAEEDFKPKEAPAWWPVEELADWLAGKEVKFNRTFLLAAKKEMRDHVQLEADSGTAAESRLFATAGLSVTHLPRYRDKSNPDIQPDVEQKLPFRDRYAEVSLAARVTAEGWPVLEKLNTWHPLGGERRLVHWQASGDPNLWSCPKSVTEALSATLKVRMVLATPAIFEGGWKPGWLNGQLVGTPPGSTLKLKLVGVCISRWRAVSGWSMQPLPETKKPGPKAIRRFVPAGGTYFFETVGSDNAAPLAARWLESVSDNVQDQRDGFGLAVWGTW